MGGEGGGMFIDVVQVFGAGFTIGAVVAYPLGWLCCFWFDDRMVARRRRRKEEKEAPRGG